MEAAPGHSYACWFPLTSPVGAERRIADAGAATGSGPEQDGATAP